MKSNISNLNLDLCTGCAACSAICKRDAITFTEDRLGFKKPKVDVKKCINCGVCIEVCQIKKTTSFNKPLSVFGGRHISSEVLDKSRSGGAFTALSDYILNNKGIVYGAAWTSKDQVEHVRVSSKENFDVLRNSKYIQSIIYSDIHKSIEKDLKDGFLILFSGTPCQITGIRNYLTQKRLPLENIFFVDIVCQGVASPSVWREYVRYFERKYESEAVTSNLRDKTQGWSSHFESLVFTSGKKIINNYFINIYYKNLMLRECCYSCRYCSKERGSDITLGDFWGWEKFSQEFNKDNKGCSMIIINTEKGLDLFNKSKDDLNLFCCDLKDIIQDNLAEPTPRNEKREEFIADFSTKGVYYILVKYAKYDIYSRIRRSIHNYKIKILRRIKE